MVRNRQIHNIWSVSVSDAPASGYCYANYANDKHNNPSLSTTDKNLLKQLDRINSFSYNINVERTNLTQLGVRGLIDRPVITSPSVQVNFNYWSVGVRNENKLGLIVNYNQASGNPLFSYDQCCFNNFTGYETDSRNLFVAVSPDNADLNNQILDNDNEGNINPNDLFVFGFGNCYLNSYRANAAVGQIPQVSVGYICDNVVGYASGSGANIPAVDPKSGNLIDGIYFTIPRLSSPASPSVIQPKDIILQINDINSSSSSDATFGILSSGLPIQSFGLSVSLEREDLKSIGYKYPIDRRINFPILADLNLSVIINDNYNGNLSNILEQNKSYDVLINMYNSSCSGLNGEIAVQYKLKDAKFTAVDYEYGIGSNLIGNFTFVSEIDVNNNDKGLFISGLLNTSPPEYPYDYLVLGTGIPQFPSLLFLLTENNDTLILGERIE